MSKYDNLKKLNAEQASSEKEQFDLSEKGLDELLADTERTSDIYNNAETYLADIDRRFEAATGLDKTDVAVLMLATALQIGRWVVIGKINEVKSKKLAESRVPSDDKSIKNMEKKKRDAYREKHKDQMDRKSARREWYDIISDSVPYDITEGIEHIRKSDHRFYTLGHDPVLGWIFGTMNILSDTITFYTFETRNVCMDKGNKHVEIGLTTLAWAFSEAVESAKEDSIRLQAAVFMQALHYKSDIHTKFGLPVPILETFLPNLALKLYREGYDFLRLRKDLTVIGSQAVVSVFINLLITLIHGLYYDPSQCPDRDWFEVKTRKILMWSNIIASSLNLTAFAAAGVAAFLENNPDLAAKKWQYLDIGGYIITMYRLVSDVKFIAEIKSKFLENEWERLVVGDSYNFLWECELNEQ